MPEPAPFNDLHADLNRGKWCKCGIPIWRRAVTGADRREAFDHRTKCRVCSLKELSSAWVRDEAYYYEEISFHSPAEYLTRDAVSIMLDSETIQRTEARARWAGSKIQVDAANAFVPLEDVWKERFQPAIGSSSKIGYRARHVMHIYVRRINRNGWQDFYPYDCGYTGRKSTERTREELEGAPDSDMCVTDEPMTPFEHHRG